MQLYIPRKENMIVKNIQSSDAPIQRSDNQSGLMNDRIPTFSVPL
jgi:hypothetical protein